MPNFDPSQAGQNELARLFTSDFETEEVWNQNELPSLFHHQLQAPLAEDLDDATMELGNKSKEGISDRGPKQPSFADVLFDPDPSLEILVKVKNFAKHRGEGTQAGIPRNMAAVLYLTAISAALVRCGERITDATDEELLAKLRWASGQDWIDDSTRSLIREAISRL